jgi:shikimate kinase
MTINSERQFVPPMVALAGFMAVGKSTVGRALASQLRWRFIDLDQHIERRSKLRVHEIFAMRGEAGFRRLETGSLRAVLERRSVPTVIALGGGTFVQPKNAELLRNYGVRVVFLELPLGQLLQRCRAATERCLPNSRPLASAPEALCALYAKRLPLYRKAELMVSTHGKTARQVSEEIAAALNLLPAGKRNV